MNEKIIPTQTDSYDTLNFVHSKCVSLYKKAGYTPLQVAKDIKPYLKVEEASKCTYVGRLDPMAEGWIYILWSGDMEEKERLASQDKIYEIDVLCGLSTDTGDVLGLIKESFIKNILPENISETIQSFVGPFTYPYPTYSSPNIKKTLNGTTGEIRLQKGYLHKIEEVSLVHVDASELEKSIFHKLSLCHMDGDFRLEKISDTWKSFFTSCPGEKYLKITLRVCCGGGTYMRTLAEEIGKKLGTCGLALSIKRIGVGSRL